MTRFSARVRFMSVFQMLLCAKNCERGYCSFCKIVDDENHRMNYCARLQEKNLFDSPLKKDFESIYSDDDDAVQRVIQVVNEMRDLKNGKNPMRT